MKRNLLIITIIGALVLLSIYLSSSLLRKPQPNGWSPDGEWIAFSCGVYNNFEDWSHVYIMRHNGSSLLQVTGDEFIARSPTWSQDGQWIAFINGHNRNEIVKIKPDGTYSETIANAVEQEKIEDIDWSPTRSELAYDSIGYERGAIYLINADDKQRKFLTASSDYLVRLKWSPDGEKIAYANLGSGSSSLAGQGFYTIGRDDAEPTFILEYFGIKLNLTWSMDGKSILGTLTNRDSRLYDLNLESKALLPITLDDFWNSPNLSPNGEWIAFEGFNNNDVGKKGGDRIQIYKSRLDNTSGQRLTEMSDCVVGNPDWFKYKKTEK